MSPEQQLSSSLLPSFLPAWAVPPLISLTLLILAGQFDNHLWRLAVLAVQWHVFVLSTLSSSPFFPLILLLQVATAAAVWWTPHFANVFQGWRPKKGCVFVTGCDSGMGQATVIGLARAQQKQQQQSGDDDVGDAVVRGMEATIQGIHGMKSGGTTSSSSYEQIFAGCFDPDSARRHLEAALTEDQLRWVTVIPLDVTDDKSVSNAANTVRKWIAGEGGKGGTGSNGSMGLTGLVLYHGVAYNGPAEYMPVDMYRRQMDVNYIGSVRVVQAFLPLMRDRADPMGTPGRIVLTGTGGGPCTPCPPLLTAYMGSKFALEAYSQAIRQELIMTSSNVDVCVINPGFVKPTMLMEEGLKLTEKMWTACEASLGSSKARDTYGMMMDHFLQYSELQPGTHVSQVVAAADHALRAPIPRSSYKVGIDSKLAPIVGMMPTGMREWVARNGIYGVLSPAGTVPGYAV